MQQYSVMIGMCTGSSVHAETVTSLIGAMNLLKEKGIPVMLSIQIGGYKAHNMNELVHLGKENKATHLMSIDSDQTFPPSGILRLLDNDKQIIGAHYNERGNPNSAKRPTSVIKMADKKGKLISTDIMPSKLFRCYAVGCGFSLYDMSIFDSIASPWFISGESPEGEAWTEDVDFCRKAQEAGIEVWCNPSISVGHIGLCTY